jgi:hypothetical protein
MASSDSPTPTHNILFTIPRTASNLLTQLLNLPDQPNILRHPQDGYFFFPALRYRYQHSITTRSFTSLSDEERRGLFSALHTSFKALKEWAEKAEEEGKATYVKEHMSWMTKPSDESTYLHNKSSPSFGIADAVGSRTAIPDVFLLDRVRPTFLIRHPVLTFPSLMRTAIDNEGLESVLNPETEKMMQWECTYYWHIQLYKHLLTSEKYPRASAVEGITYPIVLDAGDLHAEELVSKYAEAVGLDPRVVRFEWDDAGSEGMGKMEARMKDTLLGSRGVIAEKLADIDVETEKGKWKGEFGDALAERLIRLVEAAMGDYEWLYERRMRI